MKKKCGRMAVDVLAALATRVRAGDVEARNAIVEAHVPLVVSIAGAACGSGMEFHDAVQEGCIGLIRAATAIDPQRADVFPAFAIRAIRGYISNARPIHAEMIRRDPSGRHPDAGQPIVRSQLLDDDARLAVAEHGDDEDADLIKLLWRLDDAMASLSDRDADVIKRSFGLGGFARETPTEIGQGIGKSREAAGSMKRRIIGLLRRRMTKAQSPAA